MEPTPETRGLTEVFVSLAAIIGGLIVIFYLIPTQIDDPNPMFPNSKTFPYVIAGLFTLMSCRWLFTAIKGYLRARQTAFPTQLVFGMGLGLVFVFISYFIESVGYLIGGVLATTLVIVAIEGVKRWRMAVVSGVIVTIGFAIFFGKLLHIEIPVGLFGLF